MSSSRFGRPGGGKTFYPSNSSGRDSRNSTGAHKHSHSAERPRLEPKEFSNYYRDRFGSHSPEEYRNLRLSYFDPKMSSDELKDLLEKELKRYGDMQIKVVRHPHDDHRLAYVNFVRPDAAKKARKACTQRLRDLLGRHLKVDPAGVVRDQEGRFLQRSQSGQMSPPLRSPPAAERSYHKSSRSSPPPSNNRSYSSELDNWKLTESMHKDTTRTLFLGNLPVDIRESELRRVFERYGTLEDIDVKTPHDTNAAYAFVQFETLDQAMEAKYHEHDRTIRSGGPRVKIGYGKPLKSCRLWVGGLGAWTSIESLGREFDRYGLIEKIDYKRADNHAFVTFASVDAAADACRAMRGFPLGGKDRCIRVGFAREETSLREGGSDRKRERSRSPRRSRSPEDRKRKRSRSPSRSHKRRGPKTPPNSPPPDPKAQQQTTENGQATKSESGTTLSANTMPELEQVLSPCWTGALVLKKSAYAIRLHKLTGDDDLIDSKLRDPGSGESVKLNVTQRLPFAVGAAAGGLADRFGQTPKDQLAFLLAVANPNASGDLRLADSPARPLKALIHYLGEKQAAGVVSLNGGSVLYAFPHCELADTLLAKVAPSIAVLKNCKENCLLVILSRSATTVKAEK